MQLIYPRPEIGGDGSGEKLMRCEAAPLSLLCLTRLQQQHRSCRTPQPGSLAASSSSQTEQSAIAPPYVLPAAPFSSSQATRSRRRRHLVRTHALARYTREAPAGASCPPRVSGTIFMIKTTATTQTVEKNA